MKLGVFCKLYYTTSTRASWGTVDETTGLNSGVAPTLTEADVQEVTTEVSDTELDATTRVGNGWGLVMQGLHKSGLTFKVPANESNAFYVALLKAKFTRTSIALAALDGDKGTTAVEGLWADCVVIGMSRPEPIDGVVWIDFTCKPTPSAVPPQWVIVAAGA